MMARHLAAPFGWVSSCFNFHRLVESIFQALVRLLKVPCSRYVDDFLGYARAGLRWHGGRCMDVLLELLGFATDTKKSQDDMGEMVGLGHWVMVSPHEGKVETRLDSEKTERLSVDLKEILRTGKCSASLAGKFAG